MSPFVVKMKEFEEMRQVKPTNQFFKTTKQLLQFSIAKSIICISSAFRVKGIATTREQLFHCVRAA